MALTNSHIKRIILCGILFLAVYFIYKYVFGHAPGKEGFETVPIQYDEKHQLIKGYFKIDDESMAKIPYGYRLDPTDITNLIPDNKIEIQKALPILINYESNGDIQDGYYKIDDTKMALLPSYRPNLRPNISLITYDGNPPKFGKTYGNGYVTIDVYNSKQYDYPEKAKGALPEGMYFTDVNKNKISFLPYGKVQDVAKGYGYTSDDKLILDDSKVTMQYKDLSNNYDITFHPSVDDIQAQTGDTESGDAVVLDKEGNKVILPNLNKLDESPLYYEPGSYTYGASTYIPSYEDSIYLSKITNEPTFAKYKPQTLKGGICEANKSSPLDLETACQKLDSDTCSSTTCCVLLGGEKCVSGNEQGPAQKRNYSDLDILNKDYYYYKGKCYGNCI